MNEQEYLKKKQEIARRYKKELEELDREYNNSILDVSKTSSPLNKFRDSDSIRRIFECGDGKGERAVFTKAVNALRSMGIRTIGELRDARLERNQILDNRNVGYSTLRYIIESLDKVGIEVY